MSPDDESQLAVTAPEELTALPVVQAATEAAAYPLAKRGKHLRVQAASAQRAARGG